jgi:hypothetical protein
MRITLTIDGGFAHIPGLSGPFRIDTATMDPERAREIESLIHNARLFEQPSELGTGADQGADRRAYTLTVEDEQRSHTVRLTDPISGRELQSLVERVQALGRLPLPGRP